MSTSASRRRSRDSPIAGTPGAAMAETGAKNLIAGVEGKTPPNLVNPEALAVRR